MEIRRSKPGIETTRGISQEWNPERDDEQVNLHEQSSNKERRIRFYTINKHAIQEITCSIWVSNPQINNLSLVVDEAAQIVNEIAKRADEIDILNENDPEYKRTPN